MKRRFVWLGLAAIALGCAVLVYRGPGRGVIRGHVGDVAATMLVYALLGGVWSARMRTRAFATYAIATAIELGQLVWHARSTLAELTIGSTFDALDLVAYAAGVAVAVVWETVTPLRQADARSTDRCEGAADGSRAGPRASRARGRAARTTAGS